MADDFIVLAWQPQDRPLSPVMGLAFVMGLGRLRAPGANSYSVPAGSRIAKALRDGLKVAFTLDGREARLLVERAAAGAFAIHEGELTSTPRCSRTWRRSSRG